MSESWPNLADVTAALESSDSSATADAKTTSEATGDKTSGADATVDKLVGSQDASKPNATQAQGTSAPASKVDAKPGDPATAEPTDLAAKIKDDPRKFIATLPEDVVESMQSVLYPKLHRTLSKRDEDHRVEIARIQEVNQAQVMAILDKVDARVDDVLARTMEPDAFEEFKRQRDEKIAAERAKNAPDPAQVARQAELTAYITQAWDMISDAGFPLPEDRTTFEDMTEDVRAIWQAGWKETTPLAALRVMRAKARELKSGAAARPTPSATANPRDPATGRFVANDELARLIAEGVNKALEERDLKAGLAVTGARSAGGAPSSGKAQSWAEDTRDLKQALLESNARS